MSHLFKKCADLGQQCSFCHNLWPPADSLVSRYQCCEQCGIVLHSSCKSLGLMCIPCSSQAQEISAYTIQGAIKGKLECHLQQAYDMRGSRGDELYGVWRYSQHPLARTTSANSSGNECVWPDDSSFAAIDIDFSKDVSVELQLDLWSSYFEIFDKKLHSATVNIMPIIQHPNRRIERWFLLHNVQYEHVGRILVSFRFVPEDLPAPPGSLESKVEPANQHDCQLDSIKSSVNSDQDSYEVIPQLKEATSRTSSANELINTSPLNQQSSIRTEEPETVLEPFTSMTTTTVDSSVPIDVVQCGVQSSGSVAKEFCSPQKLDGSVCEEQSKRGASNSEEKLRPSDAEQLSIRPRALSFSSSLKLQMDESTEHTSSLLTEKRRLSSFKFQAKKLALVSPSLAIEREKRTDMAQKAHVAVTQSAKSKSSPVFFAAPESSSSKQTAAASTPAARVSTLWASVESRWDSAVHNMSLLLSGQDAPPSPTRGDSSLHDQRESMSSEFVGLLHVHVTGAVLGCCLSGKESSQYYVVLTVEDRKMTMTSPLSVSVDSTSTSLSFNARFVIGVPHLRSQLTLSLVDSESKRRIGSVSLTALYVAQRSADSFINGSVHPPLTEKALQLSKYHQNIFDHEIRKHTISFNATDAENFTQESAPRLLFTSHFEENRQNFFYSSTPMSLTVVNEPLSVERLGTHIQRFNQAIGLLQNVYVSYCYAMSWEDPAYTMLLFNYFLYCVLRVSAEHALSAVMSLPALWMTYSLWRRYSGLFRQDFVRDSDVLESKLNNEYRPVATLRVSVVALETNRSGSSRNSAVEASFDHKNASEVVQPSVRVALLTTESSMSRSTDNSSGARSELPIGAWYNQPSLSEAGRSDHGVLRDAMLQQVFDPWPLNDSATIITPQVGSSKSDHPMLLSRVLKRNDVLVMKGSEMSLLYPVLQPRRSHEELVALRKKERLRRQEIRAHIAHSGPDKELEDDREEWFVPWTQSADEVRVVLLDADNLRDEAQTTIPLRDLLLHGRCVVKERGKGFELLQWCELQHVGPTQAQHMVNDLDSFLYDPPQQVATFGNAGQSLFGRVLVRASLDIPDSRLSMTPSAIERQRSRVLQDTINETFKLARDLRDGKSTADVGFSAANKASATLTVLWNMRDHIKFVQNTMHNILCWIESSKNVFNWTSPVKTAPVYACVLLLWLLTVFIPNRILILLWGLYQFFYIFLPIPDGDEYMIRAQNYVLSLPNDDDLDAVYLEPRECAAKKLALRHKKVTRDSLLNAVLPCHYSGPACLKLSASREFDWHNVFLVIQGQRVLWWALESDVQSKLPLGQVLLSGLAGITQVSPVDSRRFDNPAQLLAIFGQEPSGMPVRLSLHFEDEQMKLHIEELIKSLLSSHR